MRDQVRTTCADPPIVRTDTHASTAKAECGWPNHPPLLELLAQCFLHLLQGVRRRRLQIGAPLIGDQCRLDLKEEGQKLLYWQATVIGGGFRNGQCLCRAKERYPMVQEVGNRFCRDLLNRSCVRSEDMPQEMGGNTNRFAISCREGHAMKEKTQQS